MQQIFIWSVFFFQVACHLVYYVRKDKDMGKIHFSAVWKRRDNAYLTRQNEGEPKQITNDDHKDHNQSPDQNLDQNRREEVANWETFEEGFIFVKQADPYQEI